MLILVGLFSFPLVFKTVVKIEAWLTICMFKSLLILLSFSNLLNIDATFGTD